MLVNLEKIINIEDKLEKRVRALEDKLESVEETFDQTLARIGLMRNNGNLTEDDLYEAIKALSAHHMGEESITEELIKLDKQLERYKEKGE